MQLFGLKLLLFHLAADVRLLPNKIKSYKSDMLLVCIYKSAFGFGRQY